MSQLSPKRARLASFEHAYAVATRLRCVTGRDQFVIRTGDPLQPVRVTSDLDEDAGLMLALVL